MRVLVLGATGGTGRAVERGHHVTAFVRSPEKIAQKRRTRVPVDFSSMPSVAVMAVHLLAATGSQPAHVFGSSSGGLVGLALAARYPQQVRTLVVHEPPPAALLADTDPRRVAGPYIVETYRKHGVGPALQKFAAMTGLGTGQRPGQPGAPGAPPSPEMRETMAIMQQKMARMQPNVEYFLAHLALSIGNYVPDRDALRARSSLVVVAVGDESRWPRT